MPNAYFIPSGPANLTIDVPWKDVATYHIEVLAGGSVIATSPEYQNVQCCQNDIRVHFRNFLGGVDSIAFRIESIDSDTKSELFEHPENYPLVVVNHGLNRISLHANVLYSGIALATENQMSLFRELYASTLAWIEGVNNYIPVVVSDGKRQIGKSEDTYEYEMPIELMISNLDKVIRN